MPLPSAIWPNFWDPLKLKIFLAYGYSVKKYIYHSIIWQWAVLCKNKDGGWIKFCEIFSGTSLPLLTLVIFRETVPLRPGDTYITVILLWVRWAVVKDFTCRYGGPTWKHAAITHCQQIFEMLQRLRHYRYFKEIPSVTRVLTSGFSSNCLLEGSLGRFWFVLTIFHVFISKIGSAV